MTGARLSTGLEFLFDAGDRVLQVLAALFLLRIAERGVCRKSALMRTPGGFIDSLAGRRIVCIRLGKCIPDRRSMLSKGCSSLVRFSRRLVTPSTGASGSRCRRFHKPQRN